VKSIISYIREGRPRLHSIEEVSAVKGVRKAGSLPRRRSRSITHGVRRRRDEAVPEVRVFKHDLQRHRPAAAGVDRPRGMADVMFVLGRYNSANTRRLAEICKAINPRTHHIETKEELTPSMVEGASVAG